MSGFKFLPVWRYNDFDMPNFDELIKIIKESQRTLFILCGFPYAGKSFVAKEIQKRTDIVYVSIDAIFHTYGFDWDTNTLPDTEVWQKIFNESYKKIKEALSAGKNVLYDSTNQTIASRDKLRAVAQSVGADTKVLYVQSSTETVWKRWEENQKTQTRSVVSRELIQRTIDMFEVPTKEENVFIVVNNL